VKKAGASALRGGAFKPRSSAYSFQGLGEEGLKLLEVAKQETGLPIVTELVDVHDIELVLRYADMIQVGARNMQNFALLKELGKVDCPVFLKRGMSAKIDEWLSSAEYVLAGGNERVVLCERGIRTFETSTRNTLDLNCIPVLRTRTHLPVVVDPSHGTGVRRYVSAMSLAAVAAGADGLMIEVHNNPDEALSDGAQSLTPGEFVELMKMVEPVVKAVNRTLLTLGDDSP
jgi:3-deoxy-7-phosphoheptulonate synthase